MPGVANALKHFLFKSNAKRSALRLVRESELYGGLLSSSISKENLYITAEFLRGDECVPAQAWHTFVEEVVC